jgi:ribulose-phosphate 3-epimerase
MRIFTSLLPVKESDIDVLIVRLNRCIDGFHIDIMDGKFVPYIAGSFELIQRFRSLSPLPLWIHLMVSDPGDWIERFLGRKGDIVSIHYEACSSRLDILKIFDFIRAKGALSSLAINPDTLVGCFAPYVSYVDQVLLMGVVPGKSGQTMLKATKGRMEELYQLRNETQANFQIALDGGINPQSLAALSPYFPDDIAAASSILHHTSPCEAVAVLRKAV